MFNTNFVSHIIYNNKSWQDIFGDDTLFASLSSNYLLFSPWIHPSQETIPINIITSNQHLASLKNMNKDWAITLLLVGDDVKLQSIIAQKHKMWFSKPF